MPGSGMTSLTETRSIALVGFMGAGKSSAGRAIALELGLDFIDTDERIAAESGRSIPTLFAENGEAGFREIEERVALEALERGAVVALGGGAVESERLREALATHLTVWCQVDADVAWERCAGSNRPLARDRNAFGRRFGARLPLYERVAAATLPTGGSGPSPAAAAPWLGELRSLPGAGMVWAEAGTSGAGYPALVGRGVGRAFDRLAGAVPGERLFAVLDRAAAAAVGSILPVRTEVRRFELEGGEPAKTLRSAEELLGELARAGVRRDDALLAFGGGVIGDLAGFCAAVYQRGIPIVQMPTTLVAQVDSAYGGKTGVDLPEAKNYVGSYHQPVAALADPAALATLPREELAAGFAEVVKTALIAGGPLWERVRSLERIEAATVEPLVFDCVRTKLAIVAEDERDSGRRAVLNLGHTVGHAIEAAGGFGRHRHGEAVGLGLLAALRLSEAGELREEVAALLARAGLPTRLDPEIDLDGVLEAVDRDKKRTAEGVGFVLVEAPGSVEHGRAVDPASLRAVVEELRGEGQGR